jgi:hypothetical protein
MMVDNWQPGYNNLKEFISRHPSIEINTSVLSIPADTRSDFYRLFDIFRQNLVKDTIPDFLEKTRVLSGKHEETRHRLSADLGLTEIELENGLNDFIRNPLGMMTSLLSDPAFDLLMGKTDPNTLAETSAKKIIPAFDSLFRQAYKSWLTLSLLQLMSPDAAYVVPLSNDVSAPYDYDIGNAGAQDKQMLPDAEPTTRLSFNRTQYHVLLVPKVILHSRRLNIYISLQQEFRFVPTEARCRNQQIEWYRLSDLTEKLDQGKIWPDFMLYLGEKPKDLLLVADMFNVARPDIMVNILHKRDAGESDKLATLKRQHDVFAPRLGSFIVVPEALSDKQMEVLNTQIHPAGLFENKDGEELGGLTQHPECSQSSPAPDGYPRTEVRVLGVGYDTLKLEPIADAITKSQFYADLTSNGDAPHN